jgi:sensor histidine kinase YesM
MAQYQRRNYLINKPFQLRFSMFVCAWMVAMSFIYPLVIQQVYEALIHYAAQDPSAPPVQQLIESKKEIMDLLLLSQIIFVVIAFGVSIFMSHRIAGPLYKLSLFMRRAKDGNLSEKVSFREGDYFQEMAQLYNEMAQGILRREKAASQYIAEAMKEPLSPTALQALQKAQEQLESKHVEI